MLWVRIPGYVVICSFFVSFSCPTALQEITSQSFMEILNNNLRGIMRVLLPWYDEKKGQSRSAHRKRGEKKKWHALVKLRILTYPSNDRPQMVLIRATQSEVSHVASAHFDSRVYGMPPTEKTRFVFSSLRSTTCPMMFRKEWMLTFHLLEVCLWPLVPNNLLHFRQVMSDLKPTPLSHVTEKKEEPLITSIYFVI